MPAPDYETLYQIEDALETALAARLVTATGLASDRVARWLDNNEDQSRTPRLELEVVLGSPIAKKSVDSKIRHASWSAQIIIRAITNDSRDTAAQHYTLIGQVRGEIEDWQDNLLIAQLPYHALKAMQWSATNHATDPDSREHTTALVFDTVIEIRSDAWPA